jgi:hypothetical protein
MVLPFDIKKSILRQKEEEFMETQIFFTMQNIYINLPKKKPLVYFEHVCNERRHILSYL